MPISSTAYTRITKPPTTCSIKFLSPKLFLFLFLFLSKMMNLLSLSLLISSLAAAGLFSPPPPDPIPPIREGHRIFVVEYDRQSPPPSSPPPPPPTQVSGDVSGDFKDAAADFSNPPEGMISSIVTKTKQKAAQMEESSADAVKTLSEKAKTAGKEVAANISAATKKSVHQAQATVVTLEERITDVMRRARDFWRDVALHVLLGVTEAASSAAAAAHLFGFAIAFGTCVWVTFASSHVLASALPRQQFGIVQSRIYPVYFGAVGLSIWAAVVAFYIGNGWRTAAEKAQVCNLLAALGMVMVNLLYMEPRATKVMFERMKLEKEDSKRRDIAGGAEPAVMGLPATPNGLEQPTRVSEMTTTMMEQETVKSRISRASKTLRRLNTYSSFLNVLSLMALSWHLVYLAQRLELRS